MSVHGNLHQPDTASSPFVILHGTAEIYSLATLSGKGLLW